MNSRQSKPTPGTPTMLSITLGLVLTVTVVLGTVMVATGDAGKWTGFMLGALASMWMIVETVSQILRRRIAAMQARIAEIEREAAESATVGGPRRIKCNADNCDGVVLSDAEMDQHLKLWHSGKWGSEKAQSKPGPY